MKKEKRATGCPDEGEKEEENDQSPTHKPNLQVICSPRCRASLVQLRDEKSKSDGAQVLGKKWKREKRTQGR